MEKCSPPPSSLKAQSLEEATSSWAALGLTEIGPLTLMGEFKPLTLLLPLIFSFSLE